MAMLAMLFASFFTFGMYQNAIRPAWEQACIKHGAAHYDQKTRRFTWNDDAPATAE